MSARELLPGLPVPELSDTLARLLETCAPLGSPEELAHLKACCTEFEAPSGQGSALQQVLQDRAATTRNWLEEWWLDFIYLRPRWPIAVWSNYLGASTNIDVEPYRIDDVQSATLQLVHALRFRELIRTNRVPPETLAGRPLCMDQYKSMFRSCRIPGEAMDELQTYDDGATHIVVLRNDHIMSMEVCDASGAILPIADITQALRDCIALSSTPFDLVRHPAVSTLTAEGRDTWARVRTHMMRSPVNAASLARIQTAILCISLDRAKP